MLRLPLTTGESEALLATMRTSHRMRVGVTVLNKNEEPIRRLDAPASKVIDGDVTVEPFADITRSLSLSLVDEKHALGFDGTSPAAGALFADNFLAVSRDVYVASLERWVEVPVFWGPLTNFERDGHLVKIEAQGKEALALDPHFATGGYTLRKGRRVDNAIRDVMDRLGENRYNLPVMAKRLPRARAVQPDDEPWDVVKFGWESSRVVKRGKGKKRRRERVEVDFNGLVALQGAYMIFYDGEGRLTARPRSTKPVITFAEGRDIVELPKPSWDVLTARNHVSVTGAKVTIGKKPNRRQVQRRGSATLPSAHPLSPESLKRNGKRRYMTEHVTADNLKTDAACRAYAKRILDERSDDGLDLSFTVLPFPMLEELDRVRVQTREYALDVRPARYTIPLTAEGVMEIGYST